MMIVIIIGTIGVTVEGGWLSNYSLQGWIVTMVTMIHHALQWMNAGELKTQTTINVHHWLQKYACPATTTNQ